MSYLEKRKNVVGEGLPSAQRVKSSRLPPDVLKMSREVFEAHFDEFLKGVRAEVGREAGFQVHGEIFPDEILMALTLAHPDIASSTTAYASADFDPAASSPKAEDLISSCVDALGAVFQAMVESHFRELATKVSDTGVTDPGMGQAKKSQVKKGSTGESNLGIRAFFGSLADLGDAIPYEWTATEMGRVKLYVRVDKANPDLDAAADEWLAKNDPDRARREEEEHAIAWPSCGAFR
jgi:hypothetical protein